MATSLQSPQCVAASFTRAGHSSAFRSGIRSQGLCSSPQGDRHILRPSKGPKNERAPGPCVSVPGLPPTGDALEGGHRTTQGHTSGVTSAGPAERFPPGVEGCVRRVSVWTGGRRRRTRPCRNSFVRRVGCPLVFFGSMRSMCQLPSFSDLREPLRTGVQHAVEPHIAQLSERNRFASQGLSCRVK